MSSLLSTSANEAASYKQQMGYLVRWFAGWSDMQKSDFLPILVDKLATEAINGVVDRLSHIGLKGRPPTLFKCQLKLFDEWFDSWLSEEKLEFLAKIRDIDSAFYDRYERKVSGEEDRLREEQEREFQSIINSALLEEKTPRIEGKILEVIKENGIEEEENEDVVDTVTTAEVETCVVNGQVATLVYVNDDEEDEEEEVEDPRSSEITAKLEEEEGEVEEEIKPVVEQNGEFVEEIPVAVEAAS